MVYSTSDFGMRLCDLLAGMGGFTCGALEAGANVVLAVDSDPAPLKLLGANAPRTTTVVATLGKEAVDLPPAAPDLHVHMSTPCTTLRWPGGAQPRSPQMMGYTRRARRPSWGELVFIKFL